MKQIFLSSIFLSLFLLPSFFSYGKESSGKKRREQMRVLLQLKRSIRQSTKGNYIISSKRLFLLMNNPLLKKERDKIRYNLALNLYNMGLYHPAIFQFQTLVRNKTAGYVGKSLQNIASMATQLQDDRLLNHAITHGSLKYIKRSERHKLHYYFGEYWMRKKKYRRAISHFARVRSSSHFFYQALYQLGLAHAELGQVRKTVQIFNNLENRRTGVVDKIRIAALMGKARAYYQGKKWERSIESYHQVPKDSLFWHESLIEKAWAFLRNGQLRSSLSVFQTIHSPYYESNYQPESMLLRSIIYLYICKYYEMQKVLDLFNRIYRPAYSQVKNLINSGAYLKSYYQSLLLSMDKNKKPGQVLQYPISVSRRVFKERDISAMHHYIMKLKQERDLLYALPYSWRRSKVGQYSVNVIKKRLVNAQRTAGRKVLAHLKKIRSELKGFFIQEKYIRYEMLRSKRGFLKKKIAKKSVVGINIEDYDRSFFIQNGYEYWPFEGEYWLDEMGNYHYVGTESCN